MFGDRPTILPGAVQDWPAFALWKPPSGLQHLRDLAGTAEVQVMCSSSGVFHGDMRSHSPTTCSFAHFLDSADLELSPQHWPAGQQVYLAQAPMQTSAPLRCALGALMQDVRSPECLQGLAVSHVNLWMSTRGARSSLHNDPYQNLLCVVAGRKTVTLFSPALTPCLYPMPVWGESPNHSSIDFAAPDPKRHPRYAEALQQKQVIVLEAGDALMIPEGWWHQIDSNGTTIAVNFWWESQFSGLIGGSCDAYYLRRVMGSLLETHKQRLLEEVQPYQWDVRPQSDNKRDAPDSAVRPEGPSAKRQRSQLPEQASASQASGSDACVGNDSDHKVDAGAIGQPAEPDAQVELQAVRVLALHAAEVLTGQPSTAPHARHKTGPSQQRPADGQRQVQPQQGLLSAARQAGHASCHMPATNMPWEQVTPHSTAQGSSGQRHKCDDANTQLPVLQHQPKPSSTQQPHTSNALGSVDTVSRVLAALGPLALRRVLLALAQRFPRSLALLLERGLLPVAAELLTSRFEEADALLAEQGKSDEQQAFYSQLYSVVDDPQRVLDIMLARKEELSVSICQALVHDVLGLHCNRPG